MPKKNQKNNVESPESGEKVTLALICDKYVNGEDRIAGYVVVQDGILVGDLTAADIERFKKAGELKVIE